jgi:hypothetical protein
MQNSSVVSLLRERAGVQNVADPVLLPPESVPATRSGKIRRATGVDQDWQRGFTWLGA